MARLFTCGFEENNATETIWSTGGPTIQSPTVHSGTYAGQFVNGGVVQFRRSLSTNVTSGTYFVRVYVRVTATPAGTRGMVSSGQNANVNGFNLPLSNPPPPIIPNLVATAEGAGPVLALNTWYRVEIRHLISDTVGQ